MKVSVCLRQYCIAVVRLLGSTLKSLPVLECVDFVGELSGADETLQDVVVEVQNPSAIPRRCWSLPLIASTGPLETPTSKYARKLPGRSCRLRPS